MSSGSPTVRFGTEFHHIVCVCGSPSCTVRLVIDEDDYPVLEFHLDIWAPWYRRLWHAVRYVFGRAVVPAYGNVYLHDDDVVNVIKILQNFQERRAKHDS